MSVETPKPVVASEAPAPVEFTPVAVSEVAGEKTIVPAAEQPKVEDQAKVEDQPKVEGDAAAAAVAAPVEEEKKDEKAEEKVVEPIHSGALGYKAPGLKNAFRFAKKYFWFGEEPIPVSSLGEYLRGEKPEVAHPVAAWSSQTGKGLLYFVKHADKKESPAGVLNLAYATDLVKDGTIGFAFKISGHKHAFEAQSVAERDGWFVAVEKAIAEAKEAKESIESSEAYKEEKTKLGKPTALAGATTAAAAPKKSVDATRPAETEAPVAEATGPARTGSSSSSSSSDAEKKNKKKAAKSKSRSVSRKRASIFGGLLGKKDKADEHAAEPEAKKEESVAPQIGETSTTAPVITSDIPSTSDELKSEPAPAPVVAETATPAPIEAETATPVVAPAPVEKDEKTAEKPKPTKRGSIFGSFFEKVKSPSHEKKEADLIPAVANKEATKETTAVPETQKPVEETPATETAEAAPLAEAKLDAPKPEAAKPVTPVKEKEHFSFGKLFGNKEKAKSPAVETPSTVAQAEQTPKTEDAAAPVVANGVEPAVPVAETSTAEPVVEKKEETPAVPKKEKRTSIFGSLARTVSKAGGKKEPKEKKETVTPPTVQESAEPADKVETPAVAQKETPAVPAQQSTIGDVTPEAVNVGEAPKSSAPVATTA